MQTLLALISLVPLADEAVAVNPPGWLGGLLALVSVAAPTAVYFWYKNRTAVPRPQLENDDE